MDLSLDHFHKQCSGVQVKVSMILSLKFEGRHT